MVGHSRRFRTKFAVRTDQVRTEQVRTVSALLEAEFGQLQLRRGGGPGQDTGHGQTVQRIKPPSCCPEAGTDPNPGDYGISGRCHQRKDTSGSFDAATGLQIGNGTSDLQIGDGTTDLQTGNGTINLQTGS